MATTKQVRTGIRGKLVKLLVYILIAAFWFQPAAARVLFGEARIVKGSLDIVRNGKTLTVKSGEQAAVQLNDLLMVGSDSGVNWQVDQITSAQIGSNSILMLRPWKRAGQAGYLNLGFGISRVRLQPGRESGQPLVLKTPTAIIRLTGSVWVQVTSSGSTMVKALAGKTKISNLSGDTKSITVNQLALVVNSELIIPNLKVSAESQLLVDDALLDMPRFNGQQASLLRNEAELIMAGVLDEEAVQQSKSIQVSSDESFDERSEISFGRTKKRIEIQPYGEDLAADLEILDDMTPYSVDSESNQLGVILILEEKIEAAMAEFDEPKMPDSLFDLDDKTSWSSESGLISVTFEK